MQVTPSSSSLFSGLTGANSQAPAPAEPQGPAMGLAGPDMAAAAPSTLVGYNKPLLLDEHQTLTVGYNKPLQVNDGALTRVGYNKPLLLDTADSTSPHTSLNPLPSAPAAPAAPGNAATRADKAAAPGSAAAHSTAPKADPMEIAALELLLAEPANRDMVQHFGGPLQPLPTDTATGQGIQARYGADLGARLSQLQTAQQAVRAEYYKAWESAAKGYGGPDQPGWLYTPGTKPQHADDSGVPARWDFDPVAFTQHYASGDSHLEIKRCKRKVAGMA